MDRPRLVHVTLPADRPPWTSTGLTVSAGDEVTLLGSGFIHWSDRGDAGAGAKFHLWGRVRGGRAFGCTQDTTTTVADQDGELEVCVYRGAWADDFGRLATGVAPYARGSGALQVTAIAWPSGMRARDGLAALDDVDRSLTRAELARLASPVVPPPGWAHLRDFGPSDVFRAGTADGATTIEVHCDDDIGILTTPVQRALTPSTRLQWWWRVDVLPSIRREDEVRWHDYLSIAVAFDDGRDLTWFWSAELPPESGFPCPAPAWRDRETHVSVRSGPAGLGTWQAESRPVMDDVVRFMGAPPDRIAGIWLIAVSHFSRSLGRATFRDIRLVDADGVVPVPQRGASR